MFEWGHLGFPDFQRYRYRLLSHDVASSTVEGESTESSLKETTLGETLGVYPRSAENEHIMILGCGNSKFGEDMLAEGWKGPLVQVDIAARLIESMSQRCASLQKTGDMQFVQDDATVLSSFQDNKLAAVLDKGLVDALFCADAWDQCFDIMRAVHRVLLPGGHFVLCSFSRPEFVLEKLLVPPSGSWSRATRNMWEGVQIRELDTIFIYRFEKSMKAAPGKRRRNRR